MKRTAIILVLLVFIGGCSASDQPDQSAGKPPEYLSLPEKATEELSSLGIRLPELPYKFTPPLDGDQDKYDKDSLAELGFTKPRLTTHDKVTSKSDIWDVNVEATIMRDNLGDYNVYIHAELTNKTDKTFNNVKVFLAFNPQLEYHYDFNLTCGGHKLDELVPLGSEEGSPSVRYLRHFLLPNDNPFHLAAPELKQKFDIFFRDMYIFTEWDGGREVYWVNPDDIEFSKDIKN